MKVLFDQGTPVPLRRLLHPHQIDTAAELLWSRLQNGRLLDQAEAGGYEALITTDQNLRYQQNLVGRKIRIIVLMTISWPRIQRKAEAIRTALEGSAEGEYVEIAF